MELVLDLARRWWRFKVKDMSPEKLQIISPTQIRLPHVLGLTPFDICYILNDQTLQMTSSSSRSQRCCFVFVLGPLNLFQEVRCC